MSRGHRSDRRESRRSRRDRDRDSSRDRDRSRDRHSRRHSDRKRDRSRDKERSRSHKSGTRRSSSGGGSSATHAARLEKLPVPRDFHCHLCGKVHWTVDCDLLRQSPDKYPLLDAVSGCCKCGQRGHNFGQCRIKKYLCQDCGGMHDTRDCVYAHVGEDWYEFFDQRTRHVYYVNSDESQVQWTPPTHQLDTVYWYCPHCKIVIPAKHRECLLCHFIRPVSKPEVSDSSDSDSDSDSDSSDSSSSSSSSSSGWSSSSGSTSSRSARNDSDGDSIRRGGAKRRKAEIQ